MENSERNSDGGLKPSYQSDRMKDQDEEGDASDYSSADLRHWLNYELTLLRRALTRLTLAALAIVLVWFCATYGNGGMAQTRCSYMRISAIFTDQDVFTDREADPCKVKPTDIARAHVGSGG